MSELYGKYYSPLPSSTAHIEEVILLLLLQFQGTIVGIDVCLLLYRG